MLIVKKIYGYIRVFLITFLGFLLPNRFKRYILLTTIYKKGFDEHIFENLNFYNLNNRLRIANDVKAMENISLISTRLWSEVELKKVLQDSMHCSIDGECVSLNQSYDIGEKLLDMVPSWLRYDRKKMQQDLASLFASERVHLSQ